MSCHLRFWSFFLFRPFLTLCPVIFISEVPSFPFCFWVCILSSFASLMFILINVPEFQPVICVSEVHPCILRSGWLLRGSYWRSFRFRPVTCSKEDLRLSFRFRPVIFYIEDLRPSFRFRPVICFAWAALGEFSPVTCYKEDLTGLLLGSDLSFAFPELLY
jgi:hypothetical protein